MVSYKVTWRFDVPRRVRCPATKTSQAPRSLNGYGLLYVVLLSILRGRAIAVEHDLYVSRFDTRAKALILAPHLLAIVVLSIPGSLLLMAAFAQWQVGLFGPVLSLGGALACSRLWRGYYMRHGRRALAAVIVRRVVGVLFWVYLAQLTAAACLSVIPMGLERQSDNARPVRLWKGSSTHDHVIPVVGIAPMVDPSAYYVRELGSGQAVGGGMAPSDAGS